MGNFKRKGAIQLEAGIQHDVYGGGLWFLLRHGKGKGHLLSLIGGQD